MSALIYFHIFIEIVGLGAAAMSIWDLANSGSEMRAHHDLETHLKRNKDLTDNLNRISREISVFNFERLDI